MDAPRDQLLDAALPLLVDRGVHALSVAGIAQEAGIDVGTASALFADVPSLANSLYRHWKTELTRAILGDGPPDADPREQFRVFWYRGPTSPS